MSDHQRISRRALLAGFGSAGLLTACAGPAPTAPTGASPPPPPATTAAGDLRSLFAGSSVCALTPATTAGPYHFDADRIRRDIREDRPGVRLRLAIRVQDSESCGPLPGAVVEIWHCDATGLYSGTEPLPPSARPPSGPAPSGSAPTADFTPADGRRYLRGAQVTDADGIVEFVTIWPGWHRGRTPHVYAMVHTGDAPVLTTQMMFPEKANDAVFARAPYAARTGRDTTNAADPVYTDSMLLKITTEYDGHLGVITFSADADHDGR